MNERKSLVLNEREVLKVLVVVTQLNRGGIESRLMDILRKMDYSQVQIDIFTCRKEPGIHDGEAKKLGSVIYYNEPLTVRNMFGYVKYFENFLTNHPEYKIVHAQQDAWCSVFCKGAFNAGVPIRIAHSRTAISTFSLKNLCKNIIKLPCRKYATHYFAVSGKAGKWLFGKRLCNSGKVNIWKNAIDCEAYRYDEIIREEERNKLKISQEEIVLIHVGNFTTPKNHSFLINVFEQVLKKDTNAILILVGGTALEDRNMEHIKTMVSDKIWDGTVMFLGSRNDVYRLLQAGDIFVFPSLFEGFPGAVLEAQASGLPCVISDTITEEVVLLDSVKTISLNESCEKWAEVILSTRNIKREDTFEKIVQEGFHIDKLVCELTEFYEKEAENYVISKKTKE